MGKFKTFISYDRGEAELYRLVFENKLENNNIATVKTLVDIKTLPDNLEDYISFLIENDFIAENTIHIVLISKNAYLNKFIDWEITAGLKNAKTKLIGILIDQDKDQIKIPSKMENKAKNIKIYTYKEFMLNVFNILKESAAL